MGSILSQNSAPKLKGEGSSLIEIQEILEDSEHSRETEDILKINGGLHSPTDLGAQQFFKTFHQLQKQKEHFHVELHNEVIQWRLMHQRGVSNKFDHNKKVNILIREFVKLHEQLDEFLEQERRNLGRILPQPKYFISKCDKKKSAEECTKMDAKERDSLELTPEAMQRLVCFQQCNDQHILILTQVLSDIEDCKTFVNASPATTRPPSSKQTSLSEEPSNRPITITLSATDSQENIHSSC
ncbi:hypothetical protein QZH41_008406 [Actinostola sp. cb2023]|nr:hypothetical protein QZH41_008406 [Actinostola sp. cb2023]